MSPAFAMGGIQAAMLANQPSIDFTVFYKPFTFQVWMSFFLIWFYFGFVLYFISRFSQKMKLESRFKEDSFSLSESVWYFSMMALHFGLDRNVTSISGKILQIYWSFFTIIVVAIYTANLAAFFSGSGVSNSRPLWF